MVRKTVAVMLLAMLAISSFAFVSTFAQADTTINQSLWVHLKGIVNQYGEDPAFGWMDAHVRMINANGTQRNWAGVHVTWSNATEAPKINAVKPPTENFTLVHYAARLMNTTDVRLNYLGYDLYVAGLWNVSKITINIYVDENGVFLYKERFIEQILPDLAPGELRVSPWQPGVGRGFEISIEDIPLLKGFIMFYDLSYREIKLFDLNNDGKVDIRDVVKVAKKWRMVPGLFNYDQGADVDFDDQIGIGDLTTIAANIEG